MRERREVTPREAKAVAHPLRVRILRLCGQQELTNKQLADRLGRDPGTVLYHVRQLLDVGFLEPAPVRTGDSGALEKPYRSTGQTWWLSMPATELEAGAAGAPIEAFTEELREAGSESVQAYARFLLHLSADEVAELDRRICAVIDEYMETEHERADRPAVSGLVVLHHPSVS
ncbi:ArsR/SmtB family transcription factor [Amycolatopsis suaedae]|uniref:ArsR/SmtB family transcription factor n=1 Tax=Amycolatopsis suaedae TaxID=2510978 RepID=UPI00196ADCC3|nr:winged helix-turn-helix domain-containing protein [Amycolatopsis suaedae]